MSINTLLRTKELPREANMVCNEGDLQFSSVIEQADVHCFHKQDLSCEALCFGEACCFFNLSSFLALGRAQGTTATVLPPGELLALVQGGGEARDDCCPKSEPELQAS